MSFIHDFYKKSKDSEGLSLEGEFVIPTFWTLVYSPAKKTSMNDDKLTYLVRFRVPLYT